MPVSGECRYPKGNVLYRRLKRSYPRIVRGEGCWLFDSEGNKYLDGSCGAYVANLGHGVGEVADAMAAQARRFGYVNGTAFTHDAVEELAAEVCAIYGNGLNKAFFLCSGADVVEAALKLSRQYWAENGKPAKRKIVSLTPSYHGNSMLALSISGRGSYRALFDGWLLDMPTVPAPYTYRCPCRGKKPECPACSGKALESAILREGPDNVAAFIAEPIGGSSTGISVPRPDYFRNIREICDRHKVLFIADEILAGLGRTGTWSALEPYGVVPDILLLGKGLGAGCVPLSAMLTSERIVDPLARGAGALVHNQTFSHHPVSCAAGVATLRLMKREKMVERAAEMGRKLFERLQPLAAHPHVGDIRGRGLLAGIEFVADQETRAPFPRALKFAETFTETAMGMGLVVWPNYGQAEGGAGDLAMLAPPFVISDAELDELVRRFGNALEAALKQVQKGAGA
ncbi:MAG: hypothetical protein A2X36_04170 [Elusimicrobia bacterium GWA2_69_24]|nr:MAG: hypothetical protein A2X36_04170 [Elusimicrobia bacterium GWA2_69_24]HBL16157.1 aspartate aminotransferase family protein [Elusimicrobiota bacterium]